MANLCFVLIHIKNPLVRMVNEHGEDAGIDACVRSFETSAVIYQFIFFKGSLGKPQVRLPWGN